MSTSDLVVAPPTSDLVDARATQQYVITTETHDDIVAPAATYRLGDWSSAKNVSTCRSPDVTLRPGPSSQTG
ncbi:MAG: hypothetical protein ABI572_12490 [Actinomycetota bacterium]